MCRKLKKGGGQHKIKHHHNMLSQPIHSHASRWHLERLCISMFSVTFLLFIVELYLTLGGTRVGSFSEAPCFNPLHISTSASYKCQTTSLGISLISSLPISIKISQLRFAVLWFPNWLGWQNTQLRWSYSFNMVSDDTGMKQRERSPRHKHNTSCYES